MTNPTHLIERAAERLGSATGATGQPGPAPAGLIMHGTGQPKEADPGHHGEQAVHLPSGEDVISRDVLERAGLVLGVRRSRISEEFQISASRVLRAMRAARPGSFAPAGGNAANLVMVTSAKPGEGKSFSALNLAASIARHGPGEVLLVDTDAKRLSISHALGLTDRAGLLDLATDARLRIEDTIVRTCIDNLSVLPVGARLADRDGAALTRPMSAAVDRVARRYPASTIVLDAPPCLSTSDPTTLAPLVGQVVLVVKAEQTQRSEVEAAIEHVKACPSVTLLLNRIRLTTSHTFGAYHYFGLYS